MPPDTANATRAKTANSPTNSKFLSLPLELRQLILYHINDRYLHLDGLETGAAD